MLRLPTLEGLSLTAYADYIIPFVTKAPEILRKADGASIMEWESRKLRSFSEEKTKRITRKGSF